MAITQTYSKTVQELASYGMRSAGIKRFNPELFSLVVPFCLLPDYELIPLRRNPNARCRNQKFYPALSMSGRNENLPSEMYQKNCISSKIVTQFNCLQTWICIQGNIHFVCWVFRGFINLLCAEFKTWWNRQKPIAHVYFIDSHSLYKCCFFLGGVLTPYRFVSRHRRFGKNMSTLTMSVISQI